MPSDPASKNSTHSVASPLLQRLLGLIRAEGGFLPFDRFMACALYEPGLGYYANSRRKFGRMPGSGSDFVTAPELSALFGQTLAVQVRQALQATQTDEVWEFGAGSGALAQQLMGTLGEAVRGYHVVELSAELRERQQQVLAPWGARVQWHSELPADIHGVVVGNEVLDAMPVQLLHFDGQAWAERGVAELDGGLCWADRPTELRPPVEEAQWRGFAPDTVVEIHLQAEAFVRTLGERLRRGAAFFIDYGFPEAEYYHPQRTGGTLMCHQAHVADTNPLVAVGEKDITAHVNFTGIALAAQDSGLQVLGYTSQGRFLLNCGLVEALASANLAERSMAQKLVNEHEMGELFKVIALGAEPDFGPVGFRTGDRTHRL